MGRALQTGMDTVVAGLRIAALETLCTIPQTLTRADLWEPETSGVVNRHYSMCSAAYLPACSECKPSQYIIIGLLVTTVFVLTVWGVVKLVMTLAGV